MFDRLVVGAGCTNAALAERLAHVRGERVLVVDRRDHVGGNAYDQLDEAGVLVHRYGPHSLHALAAFRRIKGEVPRADGGAPAAMAGLPVAAESA